MVQVAALAKPAQIVKAIVCFITVQVCRCKHHKAAGLGVSLVIFRAALRESWRTLAAVGAIILNCAALYKADD